MVFDCPRASWLRRWRRRLAKGLVEGAELLRILFILEEDDGLVSLEAAAAGGSHRILPVFPKLLGKHHEALGNSGNKVDKPDLHCPKGIERRLLPQS